MVRPYAQRFAMHVTNKNYEYIHTYMYMEPGTDRGMVIASIVQEPPARMVRTYGELARVISMVVNTAG